MLARGTKNTPFVIHTITNPYLKVDGDKATGHWYMLNYLTTVYSQGGPQTATSERLALGIYKNKFVRGASGWLIKDFYAEVFFFEPFTKGWTEARQLAR